MAFNVNRFMMDPWTQMGLGILAANKPGANFGQAVGGGMLAGMQNLAAMKEQEERSKYRQLQAEQFKQQMEAARRQAEQEARMQEDFSKWIASQPENIQRLAAAGGRESVAAALEAQAKEGYKIPNSLREFMNTQDVPGYGAWLDRMAKAKGVNVSPTITVNPLERRTVGNLQEQSVAAKQTVPMIDRLIADTQTLPSGIGGVAEARESVGGVFGQLADIGVPAARTFAEWIRPEATVIDPSAPGGERKVTGQTLRTQAESLTIKLKPLMADSGPLSNQDRVRLSTAMGDVASADSERRLEALMTIRNVIAENQERIDAFLRMGGGAVPGEMGYPTITSPEQLEQLKPGDRFIAPDGSVRIK